LGVTCFPLGHPFNTTRIVATRIAWEPWHKQAYAEVAACLQQPTRFPSLTLYVADGPVEWAGVYDSRRVYLHRQFATDTAVLKHEFVHYLEGIKGHGPLFLRYKACGFTPPWGIW